MSRTEAETDSAAPPLDGAGTEQQFAELYDRYAPMLFRYALRRLGAALAEDAVSETFLAAFAHWDRYDPARGDVRPWLFGILTRKISRHHRDETTRYRLLAALPKPAPTDDLADRVAETVSAGAARAALTAALAVLQSRDRDVLLLVAWAELSYPQVADVLGIPVGTVRSRLNRARRIVREHLPPDLPAEQEMN